MDVTEGTAGRLLRRSGHSTQRYTPDGALTECESEMLRLQQNEDVAFAGPLAGFAPGILEVCGQRILVTRGPRCVTPKQGRCRAIDSFLKSLLPDGQHEFAFSWLKSACAAQRAGRPFRPGQMLAIAGPAGCGKSLFQSLITEILGGRTAKPYRYMTGGTDFNSELFGAEHLAIEDEASTTDIRTRRHFGAQLKNLIVNETQSFHAKGRAALTLTPFWRISITLNDEPENLMVLPPLDESILDKIVLLKASPAKIPIDDERPESRAEFRAKLTEELPAFLWELRQFSIPKKFRCPRYGFKAWQHPELVSALTSLAPEIQLLNLIDAGDLLTAGPWIGSARDLKRQLEAGPDREEARKLLAWHTASGVYLARLAALRPDRVEERRAEGNRAEWVIKAA